jgi:ParB-like chromosome segregation protein Spo0J
MADNDTLPVPKKHSPEVQIIIDPRKIKFADAEISSDHFFRNARVSLHKQDMLTLRKHIQEHGLLQYLTVRPYRRPNKEGYTHELILGSRRLRAILFLLDEHLQVYDKSVGHYRPAHEVYNGQTFVVNCRDCDDEEAIALSLGENLEREQLSDLEFMTFVKELSELKDTDNKPKFSRDQIARFCNRSTSWVSLTLTLDQLPEMVKDLMEAGRLTRTAALSLLQTDFKMVIPVVKRAVELLREEARREEREALAEFSEAVSDADSAETDAAYAALMLDEQSLASANRRLKRSKKRVRAASEKRKVAKKKAEDGQITADHINQANVLVPGAKKGKPKPLAVRLVREHFDHFKTENGYDPNDPITKGVCAAMEWFLGRRFANDISTLIDQAKTDEEPVAEAS